MDAAFFEENRKRLSKIMTPGSIAILPGRPILSSYLEKLPTFEQNSDFYYLTGVTEPNALMAMVKDKKGKVQYVLFTIEDIAENVALIGHVIGTESAKKDYKADQAYKLSKLDKIMPELFHNIKTIYYPFDSDAPFSHKISTWRHTAQKQIKRLQKNPNLPIENKDLSPLISFLRQRKFKEEVDNIVQASSIAAQAFNRILEKYHQDMSEFDIARKFDAAVEKVSHEPMTSPTLVACGEHATSLYHKPGKTLPKDGDLIILQACAKVDGYCGTIARTFPANGKFSEPQAQLYQLLLDAQSVGLRYLKPHHTIAKVESKMLEVLHDGLVKLGVINEDKGQFQEKSTLRRLFPGELISFVGLDSKDPIALKPGEILPTIKRNMTMSINLNLCIPADDVDIPQQWRGIGLRLSDMVLTSLHSNRCLTGQAPRSINEIEALLHANKVHNDNAAFLPVYLAQQANRDLLRDELSSSLDAHDVFCEMCEEDSEREDDPVKDKYNALTKVT